MKEVVSRLTERQEYFNDFILVLSQKKVTVRFLKYSARRWIHTSVKPRRLGPSRPERGIVAGVVRPSSIAP